MRSTSRWQRMGGGSELRGPNFGEFDHFLWVTMTDEGPRMASLMLDGIWDTNIITDERLELIQPLIGGAAVRTDGIVIDRGEFTQAQTELRLTNDANLPMHIALTVPRRHHLKPNTGHLEATVAPNTVEIVDLVFDAQNSLKVDETAPIAINYTVTYAPEGHLHPVRMRGVHRVVIDSQYKLIRKGGVTVNGDLSEWGALPIVPVEPGQVQTDTDAWYGNGDGSARFGVRYDRDNLYVGVAVLDDANYNHPRRNYQRQDSLVISLDARPEDKRSGAAGTLSIPVIAGKDAADLGENETLPEGTRVVSQMTEEGYAVEVAIPMAYIAAQQGEDWETVRVNWTIHDFDPDGNARVSWRPVWSSPADYARSGTFTR
ncbi:MAG: sugar-binding protein [Candidatus Hydrogenedentales bacterium]